MRYLNSLKEFEKKLKETQFKDNADEILNQKRFNNESLLEEFHKNRGKIMQTCGLDFEDQEIVRSLEAIDHYDQKTLSFFYVMLCIDSKIVIKHALNYKIGLDFKFQFVFGADLSNNIYQGSTKSIFYRLSQKIYDKMEYAFANQHYHELENLNLYLAIIGALAQPISYQEILLSHHFVMAFHSFKISTDYCFIIPPSCTDIDLFACLFDFYQDEVIKPIVNLKSPVSQQNRSKDQALLNEKIKTFDAQLKIGKSVICSKLKGLHYKNDLLIE
jgi:hypothetical protein